MAADVFSRLERFCEESQVMTAHWSIAQIEYHESVIHEGKYRAARAAKKSNKCDCLVYLFKVFMKRIHSD